MLCPNDMNQTLNAWLYARGDSAGFCKAIEILVKGVLYKKSWKNMVNNITTIFKENYHYSFNVPLNRFWTSVCYYFIFLAFLMTAILTQVGIHNRLDLPRNGILFPKLLTYCEKKYSSVPNLLTLVIKCNFQILRNLWIWMPSRSLTTIKDCPKIFQSLQILPWIILPRIPKTRIKMNFQATT